MKYPCENCIIDPICMLPCDQMIFYLDSCIGIYGKYVPKEIVFTKNRAQRIVKCCRYFDQNDTLLFFKVVKTYEKVHGKKL